MATIMEATQCESQTHPRQLALGRSLFQVSCESSDIATRLGIASHSLEGGNTHRLASVLLSVMLLLLVHVWSKRSQNDPKRFQ